MPAFKADIKSEGQLAGQHGFDLESAKKHIDVYEATTDETQPDAVASQWPDDDKTLDDAGWLKRIYWPIALLLWYERILSTFLWQVGPMNQPEFVRPKRLAAVQVLLDDVRWCLMAIGDGWWLVGLMMFSDLWLSCSDSWTLLLQLWNIDYITLLVF